MSHPGEGHFTCACCSGATRWSTNRSDYEERAGRKPELRGSRPATALENIVAKLILHLLLITLLPLERLLTWCQQDRQQSRRDGQGTTDRNHPPRRIHGTVDTLTSGIDDLSEQSEWKFVQHGLGRRRARLRSGAACGRGERECRCAHREKHHQARDQTRHHDREGCRNFAGRKNVGKNKSGLAVSMSKLSSRSKRKGEVYSL